MGSSVLSTPGTSAMSPQLGRGITAQDAAAITRLGKLINASPGLRRASLDGVLSSAVARQVLGRSGSSTKQQEHGAKGSRRSSMGDIPRKSPIAARRMSAFDAATLATLQGAAPSSFSQADVSWGQSTGGAAGPDFLSVLAAAAGGAEAVLTSPLRGSAPIPDPHQIFAHVPFTSGMPGIPEGAPVRGPSMQRSSPGYSTQDLLNSLANLNLNQQLASARTDASFSPGAAERAALSQALQHTRPRQQQ